MNSDQPGHPPSLIRVFAVTLWVVKDPSFLHADSEDSDQTGLMPQADLSSLGAHAILFQIYVVFTGIPLFCVWPMKPSAGALANLFFHSIKTKKEHIKYEKISAGTCSTTYKLHQVKK